LFILEAPVSRLRQTAIMGRDEGWMRRTIDLAALAKAEGEVPVGALVVRDDVVLGEGWNRPIAAHDPTAHAEILALRAAALAAGDYRLGGATLYVTLEPCPMCAAAIVHARIARLVFGAWDPRQGAAGSAFNLVESDAMNHRVDTLGGVLSAECGALLRGFFAGRR
jgi:tRNA(adenine34) deaminase